MPPRRRRHLSEESIDSYGAGPADWRPRSKRAPLHSQEGDLGGSLTFTRNRRGGRRATSDAAPEEQQQHAAEESEAEVEQEIELMKEQLGGELGLEGEDDVRSVLADIRRQMKLGFASLEKRMARCEKRMEALYSAQLSGLKETQKTQQVLASVERNTKHGVTPTVRLCFQLGKGGGGRASSAQIQARSLFPR